MIDPTHYRLVPDPTLEIPLTVVANQPISDPAHLVGADPSLAAAERRPLPGPLRRAGHRAVALSAVAVLTITVLAGCGSANPPSTSSSTVPAASTNTAEASADDTVASGSATASYPAGKEEVCEARDNLKVSISALTDTKLLASGTEGIKAAVADVKTSLSAFAAAGKESYKPEVQALQSAVDGLETAVDNLGTSTAGGGVASIAGAALAAQQAASALFTKVTADCGS